MNFFRRQQRVLSPDGYRVSLLADEEPRPVSFTIVQYNELRYVEHSFSSLPDLCSYLSTTSCQSADYCTWMNVDGIHRTDVLDELARRFQLHALIEEDICTINERMKLDILDDGGTVYLLMKMIYPHPEQDQIEQEQISFVLKENNFLLTFQEAKKPQEKKMHRIDLFQIVKHRLKNNRGRIRQLKIDYLFYCLVDVLIENYMFVLDRISIKIDTIDKLLLNKLKHEDNPKNTPQHFDLETLRSIYRIKHDMLSFRILFQPLREIIIKLQKAQDRISTSDQPGHHRRQYRRKKRPKRVNLSGNYFFDPNTDPVHRRRLLSASKNATAPLFNEYIYLYFKDLNDHIMQLHDRIDTYCDLSSSLCSFYLVLNGDDMNRIMTFLTMVSVIFMPLTFTIGLCSMNFANTPPLDWSYGYFVHLSILAFVALFMMGSFKWKQWF